MWEGSHDFLSDGWVVKAYSYNPSSDSLLGTLEGSLTWVKNVTR